MKTSNPEHRTSNFEREPDNAFHAKVLAAFAKVEPVQPVYIEDASGARIGGVLFVRGEREFEIARSLFPTSPLAQRLPAAQRSEGK